MRHATPMIWCWLGTLVISFLGSDRPLIAQPKPITAEWSFDLLKLKNGAVWKGLLLEETPAQIRFQTVYRHPGRPTVWITVTVARNDVERLDKLSEAERLTLQNRLKELDPTGEGERRRMEQLELENIPWNGKPKAGWRYDSDYFSLRSDAPEEIVRRCAVRLEQVYHAYARFMPPRRQGGNPTIITLVPNLEEYQKLLMGQGRKFLNPAFYDPSSNRIFCGSDLQRLGEDLAKIRHQHHQLRQELDRQDAEYRKLYAKKPVDLARLLEVSAGYRKRIIQTDKRNDETFQKETTQLFTILHHEAFHAYVGNFVYPRVSGVSTDTSTPGELPRWLNEGLAQLFETAMIEAGELRIDQADKERLGRAKEAVRQKELRPLCEVLKSGPKQFIVEHNGDRLGSDQTYLTSWALAAYLAQDRRLLGTPAMDRFVRAVNTGENVEEAFGTLVGEKLPDFEKNFHAWLLRLRPDGTLAEK